MPRPRKNNKHLPACLYQRGRAFYFVKGGKWIPLGTNLAAALAEYGRLISEPKGGMSELIDMALAAQKLSPNTRKQYEVAARKIKKAFVEFAPEQVKPKHIAAFKLAHAKTPNMANRCLSVLRVVFGYAVEAQLVDTNPAVGIKRHEEGVRQRLITPEEFSAIYSKAGERLQVLMDLWRLTGQRVTDVLVLHISDLRDDGIYFKPRKTRKHGKQIIIQWTHELRAVVDRAKSLHGNVRALTLLHNRRGKPPDYKTVQEQWKAACRAAGVEDCQMRDLRAMALTQAEEEGKDATELAAHSSRSTTLRYLRSKKPKVVEGPSFGTPIDASRKAK